MKKMLGRILKPLQHSQDNVQQDTHRLLMEGIEQEQGRIRGDLAYLRAAADVFTSGRKH